MYYQKCKYTVTNIYTLYTNMALGNMEMGYIAALVVLFIIVAYAWQVAGVISLNIAISLYVVICIAIGYIVGSHTKLTGGNCCSCNMVGGRRRVGSSHSGSSSSSQSSYGGVDLPACTSGGW
jgi:uncharacterized membrane protein YgcG